MSRSLWKGPFVDYCLLRELDRTRKLFNHSLNPVTTILKSTVQAKAASTATPKIFTNNQPKATPKPIAEASTAKIARLGNLPVGLKIWSRRSVILPDFVGAVVFVYNGQKFIKIKITEHMIGHKFGEFSTTRKITTKGLK